MRIPLLGGIPNMPTDDSTATINKLGIHKDIAAPLIALITVSTIAWVAVLIVFSRDSKI
jgi:hypothetical protein